MRNRLKSLIQDTDSIIQNINLTSYTTIVLIKHEMDYASRFLCQQYYEVKN